MILRFVWKNFRRRKMRTFLMVPLSDRRHRPYCRAQRHRGNS